MLVIFIVVAYFVIYDGNNMSTFICSIVGGFVACILIFFLLLMTIEELLLPGDEVRKVTPPREAIKNVKAGHIAIFGLISYLANKLFCAKKPKDQDSETIEEQ